MSVIGSAVSEAREPSSATLSGAVKTSWALARVAASELMSPVSAADRRLAAAAPGPSLSPTTLPKVSTPLLSAVMLSWLVGRHEALDGQDTCDLRQRAQPRADLFRRRERGREHLYGAGSGRRIAAQIEIGRNRFGLRAVEIDRIE